MSALFSAQTTKKSEVSIMPFETTGDEYVSCKYEVGDIGSGGGYVFYRSETGFSVHSGENVIICHYLECSPDVVSDGVTWCPCNGSYCNLDTSNAIGAGKKNTEKIICADHSGEALSAHNCAAKACAEYSTKTTKAGDWYLPSEVELYLVYKNLVKTGVINNGGGFWSSSQNSNFIAYGQRFSGGFQVNGGKYCSHRVLAVHAF